MKKNDEIDLISIIVPVYNSERYLEQCVRSIIQQTYTNLEIILVDDGSCDCSGALCDLLAKEDCRIKVVHKTNGGQQDARTAGIKLASGKYLGFVDSDDWIEPEMYRFLYDSIEGAELSTTGLYREGTDGTVYEKWNDMFVPGTYSITDSCFAENLIIYKDYQRGAVIGGISNNLVDKLFLTSIAKQVADSANIKVVHEEDFLFLLIYILHCNKVCITDKVFYHYRNNPDSVTNSTTPRYLVDQTYYYQTVIKELEVHPCKEVLINQFQRRFLYSIFTLVGKELGITNYNQYPNLIFPKPQMLKNKKIVLFGAGKVGSSYLRDWEMKNICQVLAWVDNSRNNLNIGKRVVQNPEVITTMEYDFVVCAVMKKRDAENIKHQLVLLNVPESKILWEEPKDIWKEFFLNYKEEENAYI